MTERTSSPDIEALLGHSRWLRRLAAHLVSGSDGADDAVQDTFVAALRAQPSANEDLRPWLARVLRNALARRARGDGRRRAREQASGVAEAEPEPAGVSLDRLQLHRQLTDLVAALDEPFRTTVVMRYFEDKSAAEIARALAIPEGTVRWRTKEALDRLRAQLDERHHGNRKVWCTALVPLVVRRGAVATGTVVVAAAFVAVLGIVVLALGLSKDPPQVSNEEGAPASRLPRFSALVGGQRAGSAAETTLDGVVQSPEGKPATGAVVTARAVRAAGPGAMSFGTERPIPAALAISDAAGAFHLRVPAGRYVVTAADSHLSGTYQHDVEAPRAERLQLRLGTGGFVLSGQVLDQGGGPIPGARVMVQGRWLATFAAMTSSAGDYRMVLPEAISEIVVVANGYGPLRLNARIDGDERRVLRLAPGARVSGRVVANSRGVGDATVRLIPVDGLRDRWEEDASTDANGQFSFSDLPASDFRPFVREGALVTRARALLSLRAGGEEKVELALEPGITVDGSIRDGAGRPVRGAGVGFTEARTGIDHPAAATLLEQAADGNGRFSVEGVPPGLIDITPTAHGYSAHKRTLELGAQPKVHVDLVLDAASAVTGVVLRADGSPAVGAEVRGESRIPLEHRSSMSLGHADAAGRFEVLGLAAGEVTLTSWLGRDVAIFGPFPLATGERKEVKVALAPGAFVSGTVRWDNGRPAVRVKVIARNERENLHPGEAINYNLMLTPVRTNAEGRYSIGPFLPGKAQTSAFAPGQREVSTSTPRPNQAVTLISAGQETNGVDMVISSGSQQVRGAVVDRAGHPLPGATLIAVQELPGQTTYPGDAQAHQSISDGDGKFIVEGLARGTFTIFGRHPEYPDVRAPGVPAGASDAKITFPRPARLTGTVVNEKGSPIKEYFLTAAPVVPPEQRSSNYPRMEIDDRKGAFALARLAPGPYDVTVLAPKGLVARASGVMLTEGEAKRLRLVAAPGATIVGHVVDDATGAPAVGIKVVAPLPGHRMSEATTDGNGAFELRGLLAGDTVRVSAAAQDGTYKSGRANVTIPGLGITVDAGTIRLTDRRASPSGPLAPK